MALLSAPETNGTPQGDNYFGSQSSDDVFFGGGGTDTIRGEGGNDNLFGGEDGDLLYGGAGNDGLNGDAGGDFLYGDDGDDDLRGGIGGDYLYGGIGNDTLNGGGVVGEFDALYGGEGDDLLYLQPGNNVYNGGDGIDALQVEGILRNSPLTVSVNPPTGSGINGSITTPGLASSSFAEIESITTGNGDDRFSVNHIVSGVSYDAGAGTDTLITNVSNVNINLGASLIGAGAATSSIRNFENATIFNQGFVTGSLGNNVLTGSNFDDTLQGSGGNDTIHGGSGNDTVYLESNFADMTASFDQLNRLVITYAGGQETYTSVESFVFSDGTRTYQQVVDSMNAAPSAITATVSTLDENQTGRLVATLSATDADGDTVSFRIVNSLGAPITSDFYEIVDNELRLKQGVVVDFEDPLPPVMVAAYDGQANGTIQTITPTINDVAEVIVVSGSFVDSGVAETSVSGNETGNLIQMALGATGGANFFGLGGDDTLAGRTGNDSLYGGAGNDRLEPGTGVNTVDGGEGSDVVRFRDTSPPTNNPLGTYSFARSGDAIVVTETRGGIVVATTTVRNVETFEFEDGFGIITTRSFSDIFALANAAPSAPTANPVMTSVSEAAAAGTVVATLSATDADGDDITYSFATANGDGVANGAFDIVGNQIVVRAPGALVPPPPGTPTIAPNGLDFETDRTLTLYVRSSDGTAGSGLSQAITITVTDAAENLVLQGDGHHGVEYVERGVAETSVTGTMFDDEMRGSGESDTFLGGRGNDSIVGGGGDDVLTGGVGSDIIRGGTGTDMVRYDGLDSVSINLTLGVAFAGRDSDRLVSIENVLGSARGDTIIGNRHDNLLYGDHGADDVFGEAGSDLIFGGSGTDYLAGGANSDRLFGGSDADYLAGDADDDRLFGGIGDDRLNGGADVDTLQGGEGSDVFIFSRAAHSARFAHDVIVDFEQGIDTIDLIAIDANVNVAGNQAFTFAGVARFTKTAGELVLTRQGIYGDVDGDGQADFGIRFQGLDARTLTASDFIL